MTAQRLSKRTTDERIAFIERIAASLGAPPEALDGYAIVDWCARQSWSANTAATYHGHLLAWHRWLLAQGLREDDPMGVVPAPKRPRATPRPISTRQLAALLRCNLRRRTRAMILLAAFAGLRAHEVARFRGEDVDLDNAQLWVTGKGGARETVPMHRLLLEIAAVMPKRGFWFPTYTGPGRGSAPVRREAVVATVGHAMRRAGINGTCHQLRHWYGTTLLDSGVDLRTAQTLLRHASVATTERYTKVRDQRRVNAIARLDPFYDDHPASHVEIESAA